VTLPYLILGFITAAFFTAWLYHLDLVADKNHDTNYTYLTWPKNSVFRYQLIYFAVGALFFILYKAGFNVFSKGKDPVSIVKQYTSAYTPEVMLILAESFILAWLIRGICSSKSLPFFSGSIDKFLQTNFFKTLKEDIKEDHITGKGLYAQKVIQSYNKSAIEELNLKTFGNKLISYNKVNKLKQAEIKSLLNDIASASSVKTAIIITLGTYSKKQLKNILEADE